MGDIIIRNAYLPFCDHSKATELYDVICQSGEVHAITKAGERYSDGEWPGAQLDAKGQGLLLPSLCHAHIHLDKCFILDKCERLQTGDFSEALRVTAAAKSHFPEDLDDLYERGKRLILQSVESGVTCMRAHVEVDGTVQLSCLETGLRLKRDFSHICDVQIAVFAQDPFAPGGVPSGVECVNYFHLREALTLDGVEVIGSAPYVESQVEHAKENIRLIFDLAYTHNLHVDFHLDYNMDSSQEPLIWFVLTELKARMQTGRWHDGRHVCIGHATRLTMFGPEEWKKFKHIVEEARLPVTLVGLPQSDLYMMGRSQRPIPRGTLNVVDLAAQYGIHAAMAVNNVGNAFTPQGFPDPLGLCPLGVAIFQAGTPAASQTLVEAVSAVARQAIGYPQNPARGQDPLIPCTSDLADFVLLRGNNLVQSAACSPSYDRVVVKQGRIVAERSSHTWFTGGGN